MNSTPPSIDNRIVINNKQNKNKEAQKSLPHIGNGDAPTTVTINSEHIAQITRQQQELLKKQTQQLIQLKLQQEAKKQLQLAQQQQHQQTQQQHQQALSLPNDKGKKVNIKIMQNERQPLGHLTPPHSHPTPPHGHLAPPTVGKAAIDKLQTQPIKNNVKITVKTPTSANSTPANSPRLIEQNYNLLRRGSSGKTIQQINDENKLNNPTTQSPTSHNRRTKKPGDNIQQDQLEKLQQLQQQYHVQGLVSSRQVAPPANHLTQLNGTIPSPVKGQIRQPPAGRAQNGGDFKAVNMERRQEQGKTKLDDSPPSDQVIIMFGFYRVFVFLERLKLHTYMLVEIVLCYIYS